MTMSWAHVAYPQKIHFGVGAIDRVADVVKEVGGRRVLLVTTAGRRASEAGGRLVHSLGRTLASEFAEVRSHVPTSLVQAALSQVRADDIDCLVSFGGGSCADLGKAVSFFTEQEAGAPGTSYVDRPLLPHIAITTTYSGAELTPFFGMTDEAAGRKTGAGGPTIAPIAAIYDPVVTIDTPSRVSAETGMNCLAHGVECAYSPYRTPEAEAIALACIQRVSAALPAVMADPGDLDARTEMLQAAVLGGRCLHNARMGIHHALAQTVGGRTGIPHGLANAVILAHAARFNEPAAPDALAAIARAMAGPGATDAAAAIDGLRERLGLPARLSDCGVSGDDIEVVVRLVGGNPNVAANPREATEDDIRAILEAAY